MIAKQVHSSLFSWTCDFPLLYSIGLLGRLTWSLRVSRDHLIISVFIIFLFIIFIFLFFSIALGFLYCHCFVSYRLGLGSVWECLVLAGLPYCIGLQHFYLVVWVMLELCFCSLFILYLDCLWTQPFLPFPLLCMEYVKAALTSLFFSISSECVKVDSISHSVLYLESLGAALI